MKRISIIKPALLTAALMALSSVNAWAQGAYKCGRGQSVVFQDEPCRGSTQLRQQPSDQNLLQRLSPSDEKAADGVPERMAVRRRAAQQEALGQCEGEFRQLLAHLEEELANPVSYDGGGPKAMLNAQRARERQQENVMQLQMALQAKRRECESHRAALAEKVR